MSEQTTPSKKISVGLILSWIFGVLFALTGIVSVFSEPIPGLVMLIMAAVLLPPVTKLVDQKWKFHLSSGMKIVAVIIGFIIFGATIDTSNVSTTQQAEPQKEKQQATQNEDVVNETVTTEQVNEEQPQTETDEQVANEEKTETIPEEEKVALTFNEQSRQRFDEIKESFPELDNIECYNDDCTSVVYFNLNTIPDDLEFVIRGNTATFSNFKLKNTGTSHVTIFATYNGRTIFQCDGSKGVVDECK